MVMFGHFCVVGVELQVFPLTLVVILTTIWHYRDHRRHHHQQQLLRHVTMLFTDVDECERWKDNFCPQLCVNVKGSYKCRCHAGFSQSSSSLVATCKAAGQHFTVYAKHSMYAGLDL